MLETLSIWKQQSRRLETPNKEKEQYNGSDLSLWTRVRYEDGIEGFIVPEPQ